MFQYAFCGFRRHALFPLRESGEAETTRDRIHVCTRSPSGGEREGKGRGEQLSADVERERIGLSLGLKKIMDIDGVSRGIIIFSPKVTRFYNLTPCHSRRKVDKEEIIRLYPGVLLRV